MDLTVGEDHTIVVVGTGEQSRCGTAYVRGAGQPIEALSTSACDAVCYTAIMRRKIPTTFTVEFDQLERLARVADRSRLNRSSIVRDALEKELRHYETTLGLEPDGVEVIRVEA